MSVNLFLKRKREVKDFGEFTIGQVLVPESVSIDTALEESIFYLKIDQETMVDLGFKTFFKRKTNFYQVSHKFVFPDLKTKVKKTILGQAKGVISFDGDKSLYVKVGDKKDGDFFELLNLNDFSVKSLHSSVKCFCSELNIEIKI